MKNPPEEAAMSQTYRTLRVARSDEGVLSVVIDAPPMNLIGPELVRDLVTLVGHSYGGAVITNAATSAPNVVGLVYVTAFAPEEGENLGDVENGSKDSVLNSALVQYNYPAGPTGETSVEFAISLAQIREAFAADLPEQQAALLAATQRPVAAAAFSDASGPPAWRKLPCWAVVAAGDKAAGADVVRSHAQRAGADIVEVEGSHVIMISQPQAVTDHILKAAQAVASSHK
jgi:pimeloyl-ACP methyl ester carboxylesterase